MADINISVKNGLFSIQLDKWEWTGLTVDNKQITAINKGNIQFEYNQVSPKGPVHFIATANENINIVNSGNLLYMKSSDGLKTYFLTISYAKTNGVVTLNGYIHTLPFVLSDDKESPMLFSQGRMTGTFQIDNSPTPVNVLEGTKWILSNIQQGTPFSTALTFLENEKCTYGPYNGTYASTGNNFTVLIPTPKGAPLSAELKLTGSVNQNVGKGILSHVPSPGFTPDNRTLPFTLKKI